LPASRVCPPDITWQDYNKGLKWALIRDAAQPVYVDEIERPAQPLWSSQQRPTAGLTNMPFLAILRWFISAPKPTDSEVFEMVIIGENIHVIAKAVSVAMRERDAKVIQDLARAQTEAGANYIDLNVGPMKKDTEETMQWLVNTVQGASELPLSIDTMNPVAMEAGLKHCRTRPLLNSASGKTDSKENMLPLAKKYSCDVVISVMTDKGMPPDVDSKIESIMDTVTHANELGVPNEAIWVDPIILPVSTAGEGQRFAVTNLEFIKILEDVLPGVKSTVGLSNVSNGVPEELRAILNRTYLAMLGRNGLYSAIADPLDTELVSLIKGGMPKIVELIHKTMDGEDIDVAALSQKEVEYVKTVKVLMGETLYSDAWLES
jgi:5-methyltetrahydrofolate corrinoid/iron sulfur protein methyltransferase